MIDTLFCYRSQKHSDGVDSFPKMEQAMSIQITKRAGMLFLQLWLQLRT